MRETTELIEFLCVEIYNATNCLPIALTPESQIERIAMLTKTKGIIEQHLQPSDKLVDKILRIGLDFGRVYCNELPQSWAYIAEKKKNKAKTKIRKLLQATP